MLTGGQSRRMGQDKASAMLQGRPLLDHMLAKLRRMGLRARVAGDAIAGFPAELFVSDARAGCGPMSGLSTALHEGASPLVLVLGVDLPLVAAALLQALLERARTTGAMATIPRAVGRPQPLCAVYRRELAPAVGRLLAGDTFKMMYGVQLAAAESGGGVDAFDVEALAAAGAVPLERPVAFQFLNCNTPADLSMAERWLAGEAAQRRGARAAMLSA